CPSLACYIKCMTSKQNIIARLSPPGKSAIACLGVAGPAARDVVRSLFRRPRGTAFPDNPQPRSVLAGNFGDAASGADDVVLFIQQTAPAFVAEINCHGGPEVVRLLESLFIDRGFVAVVPTTWSNFVHGAERTAMIEVLTRCPTTRTAAIALDQLGGA